MFMASNPEKFGSYKYVYQAPGKDCFFVCKFVCQNVLEISAYLYDKKATQLNLTLGAISVIQLVFKLWLQKLRRYAINTKRLV